jgi:serine phosphatase RsbU (regulator of sigma subunit)
VAATPPRWLRQWRFALGDVCGTGPEAAAVTGLARHTLRILAAEGQNIADVVERLNELILRTGPKDRFVTLVHGEIVVPPDGSPSPVRVSLISAGHPLPLLLRADSDGPALEVAEPQPLLGVMEGLEFDTQEFAMYPGDILLCVTDGITERRDDSGALLDDDGGLAHMFAECRGLPAAAVVARVRRIVEDFGSEAPYDDMAILTIRARPGPTAP